ncbi:MAG TPA: molybdopterin-dependent oxidoreductase [Peptococcaceae bacterium]|nr:molybdopterin-dependent oxidoreductase [Peptococcaceae bacterium]
MKIKDKTCYKNLGLCGFGDGSNSSQVDVLNGKIVRIRPLKFDEKYSPEELNPWKIKARGKVFEPTMKSLIPPHSVAQKKRAYSPNRIKYPLKRVDWDPEGERNPQNRGKSKYVRISWDEATDLIAKEIKRVHQEYGPGTILVQGDGHGSTKAIHGPHGCQTYLLNLLGGYTIQARNADSWEGWYWGAKHVWGRDPVGQGIQANLWKDVAENTEVILYWGCDQETTPWGWSGQQASRLSYFFTELGIESIYICPDLNYGAAVHADKWIPVLPNTDAALQLAIAYVWLTEDLYDKEYIATHTVGFDKFADYVLGKKDGIPKTPKWAAEKCGVPSRTIKALARRWAAKATTIAHGNGGSMVRASYAHEPGRLEVYLLGMQGLGKPGRNQLKMIEWQIFGMNENNPAPRSKLIPNTSGCYNGWAFQMPNQFIPKTLIPDAILSDEPIKFYGTTLCAWPTEDQFVEYTFPQDGVPIHMIWSDAPCWTTCWNGGNKFIEALRSPKIECVVVQHPWLENDCLFADIILPVTTKFEELDFADDNFSGNFNQVLIEEQCIEPLYEAKSDYECVCEVAKKLGLYEEFTKGRTIEDMVKDGWKHSGIAEMVSYEELKEKGYFVIPTADDWEDDPSGFFPFYQDPEANPLGTPSGKLEYYSERLAEFFPDDEEREPTAKWMPYGETHQESLLHPRSEKYPFLIVSNHPRWRVHANLDDISWLREIQTCKVKGPDGYLYEPVWINPVDAEKLGIAHGDIVKVYNDRGWVLGGAYVTQRIIPGTIYQDHGARLDPIVPGESDRGGVNNLICPHNTTSKNCAGEVTSGFLVGVEKVDVTELAKKYPEAFKRKFDPGAGHIFENWVVGGEEE